MFVIFVIELAVGIAAAVYEKDFQDPIRNTLKNSMANYTVSEKEKVAWDNLQKKVCVHFTFYIVVLIMFPLLLF